MADADQQGEITTLLTRCREGDADARDRLFELTYSRMRSFAAAFLAREPPGHTLQPSALLNEAVVRLLEADGMTQAPNRAYLFGMVAKAMRRILIEHERHRGAQKRGGGLRRVALEAVDEIGEETPHDLLDINDALEALAAVHERASQVVTLRFLAGFTLEQIAQQLDLSLSTAESDWRFARAWLRRRLDQQVSGSH